MRKALLIAILSALILAGCGQVEDEVKKAKVESSTTSVTTTEVTSTDITDETKPSESTTSSFATTTATSKEKAKTTTKSSKKETKSTTTKKSANGGNTVIQNINTQQTTRGNGAKVQNNQPANTNAPQTSPATTTRKAVTTTTEKPKPVTTTTAKPVVTTTTTTRAEEKADWSELMKAWKKLAMGQSLSSNEENLIRADIIEYGLNKFNGKQTVTCTCGNDVTTVKFLSPLNMTANYSWNDFSHAHMDACSDAESSALINVASNDKEVYNIVEQARNDCLSVIDNGVASWHYYCDINGVLKYASDLEFSVYIDGTYVWFLTE